MGEVRKGQKAEMIEDIALVVDVIFTFVAVFLGNIGMSGLSNVSFGISGVGLMLMLVSMIVKRLQRKRKSV